MPSLAHNQVKTGFMWCEVERDWTVWFGIRIQYRSNVSLQCVAILDFLRNRVLRIKKQSLRIAPFEPTRWNLLCFFLILVFLSHCKTKKIESVYLHQQTFLHLVWEMTKRGALLHGVPCRVQGGKTYWACVNFFTQIPWPGLKKWRDFKYFIA